MYEFKVKSKSGAILYKGLVHEAPAVVTASKVRLPSVQSLIDKAAPGDEINIPHGYYHEQITIDREDIHLIGEGKVVIGGWVKMPEPSSDPIRFGKMFRVPPMPRLDMSTSNHSSVIQSHNDAMHPVHVMYQPSALPKRAGRITLKEAYDIGTYIAYASGGTPSFYVHGHYKAPEYIACYVPNEDYDNLYISTLPALCSFSDGSRDCSLENLEFDGAANTRKRPALWVRGEGHLIADVHSVYSNTIGIGVHGKKHTFQGTRADWNGQLGFWGAPNLCAFWQCHNSYNNPYLLFDSSWEAGHKFVNSRENEVKGWRGDFNGGPGFWLDISNYDYSIQDVGLMGNSRASMQIEHNCSNIHARGVRIQDVERGGRNATSVGLQVQSHIEQCSFIDFGITGCDEAIRYKKEETRGPSGYNTFISIESQDPFVIEGANNMPDIMKDVPRLIYRNK